MTRDTKVIKEMNLRLVDADIKDAKATVNKQAVEVLRKALAMAEAGEIVEVAVFGMLSDGRDWSGWSASMREADRVYALEATKTRILMGMIRQADDCDTCDP